MALMYLPCSLCGQTIETEHLLPGAAYECELCLVKEWHPQRLGVARLDCAEPDCTRSLDVQRHELDADGLAGLLEQNNWKQTATGYHCEEHWPEEED